MNKEYVYKDGKVLVIDENGNQKILDYYDNLDDVLIQENLIETMQNKEQKLERKISHLKKIISFWR